MDIEKRDTAVWTLTVFLVIVTAILLIVKRPCKPCNATGKVAEIQTVQKPCGRCKGKGTARAGISGHTFTCLTCKGTGTTATAVKGLADCAICSGKGKLQLYRHLIRAIAHAPASRGN